MNRNLGNFLRLGVKNLEYTHFLKSNFKQVLISIHGTTFLSRKGRQEEKQQQADADAMMLQLLAEDAEEKKANGTAKSAKSKKSKQSKKR